MKIDGVETQVFSVEIVKATPPADRRSDKLPSGSLAPTVAVGIPARPTKSGLRGLGVNIFASKPKAKGTHAKINELALTRCEIKLLMADRALICITECFVPPNEVTAVDTKLNKLCLGTGQMVPAKISYRRLLDSERIIVIQKTTAAVLTAKFDAHCDSVNKLTNSIQTLTEMNADNAAQRDQWRENPFCCKEAGSDYLLTMDGLKIKRNVAVALLGFAYGDTCKQAATKASVSEVTIKRALKKVRQTDYKNLFARPRAQKLLALKSMKKPDEAWSKIRKLAEEDPDKLRSQVEQVIQRAQGGVESETAWEATTRNLH